MNEQRETGPNQTGPTDGWTEFLARETAAIREGGLWRNLDHLASAPGPAVQVDGQELVQCCSNNYLGLASDRRLVAAAQTAAAHFGVGTGGSRFLGGSHVLHRQLEDRLSRLKGHEDCVLFSSGYLANVGTLSALLRPGDTVFSDRLNHASIIDGCRLSGARIVVYPHRDVKTLTGMLRTAQGQKLIVSDTIFSMDGDEAPLAELAQRAAEFGALLMVDEAHATGVLGPGLTVRHGLGGQVPLVMGTCSKALGSVGGFVVGHRMLCDYVRQRARTFVFDTSLPPPCVAATLAALEVIEQEPKRGERACLLSRRLWENLVQLGFAAMPPDAAIVPVIFGPTNVALEAAKQLRRLGVLATAVRPPTVPAGTARIRLCTMATHTDEHIERIVSAFAQLPTELRCLAQSCVDAQANG